MLNLIHCLFHQHAELYPTLCCLYIEYVVVPSPFQLRKQLCIAADEHWSWTTLCSLHGSYLWFGCKTAHLFGVNMFTQILVGVHHMTQTPTYTYITCTHSLHLSIIDAHIERFNSLYKNTHKVYKTKGTELMQTSPTVPSQLLMIHMVYI